MRIKGKIQGRDYDLSKEEVEERMRGVEPEPIRKYYVEINGRKYPIKQVVAKCLGLDPIQFTSAYAYRILSRLGFKVKKIES
ncbi:MAG: hypothetical protein DRO98_06285 [Archaeoglobales archaeon]|nr:MAG: hypothetical protein DRO98_06285 [Archaeoglobales archaeon]